MIYWTLLGSDPEWLERNAADFLSSQELVRLAELRFPKRRREWLLGRFGAKNLLLGASQQTGWHVPGVFSVLNQPNGVPFYAREDGHPLPWLLSISHRDGWAFCALSSDCETKIGVDIERIEPRPDAFLSDYFTEEEQGYARGLDATTRTVWMTAAWSMKEAVLKVMGTGLRVDTRRVELLFDGIFDPAPADWHVVPMHLLGLGEDSFYVFWQRKGEYVLSLACAAKWGETIWIDVGKKSKVIQKEVLILTKQVDIV